MRAVEAKGYFARLDPVVNTTLKRGARATTFEIATAGVHIRSADADCQRHDKYYLEERRLQAWQKNSEWRMHPVLPHHKTILDPA